MPTITLRQWEYFSAVAENGTVTAASRELHVSQSAVSTALADLEAGLGVKLFVRHARGLRLTRDGVGILREARRLLKDAEAIQSTARELGSELRGTLHVGCYSTLAPRLMTEAIGAFMERHPQVAVSFAESDRQGLISRLESGSCDIGVMYDYQFQADLAVAGLEKIRLTEAAPYALLPTSHRLAGQGSIALREVSGDPFILFDLQPGGQYFLSLFESRQLEPHVRFATSDFEMVRGLVARGVGYSLLNQRTLTNVSYEGLEYTTAELSDPFTPLAVIAVAPERRYRSRRVQAFLDVMRSVQ